MASLLLVSALSLVGDACGGILIDNFDTTQALSLTGGGLASQTSGNVATGGNSIGGNRFAALSTSGTPVGNHSLSMNDSNNGLLILSSDQADQATVVLNYTGDASGNVSAPGLTADFSTEHTVNIFTRSDQAAMGRLFVYFTSTNWSEWDFLYPGNGLAAFETISVDLTTSPDFKSGIGAILTNVAAVSLSIENTLTPGATVQIDQISVGVVPEPGNALSACISLLCLGLCGGIFRFARRLRIAV